MNRILNAFSSRTTCPRVRGNGSFTAYCFGLNWVPAQFG
jgi:hypothetical protein